jgi:hypothetical protein
MSTAIVSTGWSSHFTSWKIKQIAADTDPFLSLLFAAASRDRQKMSISP